MSNKVNLERIGGSTMLRFVYITFYSYFPQKHAYFELSFTCRHYLLYETFYRSFCKSTHVIVTITRLGIIQKPSVALKADKWEGLILSLTMQATYRTKLDRLINHLTSSNIQYLPQVSRTYGTVRMSYCPRADMQFAASCLLRNSNGRVVIHRVSVLILSTQASFVVKPSIWHVVLSQSHDGSS